MSAIKENKKYKILYIAHERKLGGATKSLLSLIEGMVENGHQVMVVVPTINCPLAKELKRRDIGIVACFFAWWMCPSEWNCFMQFGYRCLYSIESVQISRVLLQLRIKNFIPDIVHTNSSVTDFGAKLSKRIGCKHIWHVREFSDLHYHFKYFHGMKKTWKQIKEDSDIVLFISKCLKEYYEDILNEYIGEVVYNGINKECYITEHTKNHNKIVFLVTGTISKGKDQLTVLKAAKALLEEGYDNFSVFLAGEPTILGESQNYYKELKMYIEDNMMDNVSLLGRVEDMLGLRSKCDAEIVSSYMEAFGRVTVEAMFANMPVIASNSGANKEIVLSGETGVLYEYGDASSLCEAMKAYIDNPELIIKHGKNGKKRAMEFFTAEKNEEEVLLIYDEVYDGKNKKK